jgi:cell division protease FtsH
MRPGRFEFMIEIPAPSAGGSRGDHADLQQEVQLGAHRGGDQAPRATGPRGWLIARRVFPSRATTFKRCVARSSARQIRTGSTAFTTDDIDKALQRKTKRPVVLSSHEERVVAVHEAGHALVAMLLPKATPPERICDRRRTWRAPSGT